VAGPGLPDANGVEKARGLRINCTLSFEELIVSRFDGRMVAALAVWLGLAMAGYGPRVSASFLLSVTPGADVGGAGAGGPAELSEPSNSPLPNLLPVFIANNCGP